MVTNVFDAWARTLCHGIGAFGAGLPTPCLVNAGRPALYAAFALAIVLAVVVIVAWKRIRA